MNDNNAMSQHIETLIEIAEKCKQVYDSGYISGAEEIFLRLSNAFLAAANTYTDKRTKLIPIERGGTGATNLNGAKSKLGIPLSLSIGNNTIKDLGDDCWYKICDIISGAWVSHYIRMDLTSGSKYDFSDVVPTNIVLLVAANGSKKADPIVYLNSGDDRILKHLYVVQNPNNTDGPFEIWYKNPKPFSHLGVNITAEDCRLGGETYAHITLASGWNTPRKTYTADKTAYCMADYVQNNLGTAVSKSGDTMTGDLKFKSSLYRCGGYIHRVYSDNPADCGINFGSSDNVDRDDITTTERCGIKFMHSQTKSDGTRLPLTNRAVLFATDDQLYRVEYDASTNKYTETGTELGFDARYDYKLISEENNPVTDKGNQVYVATYYNGKNYIYTYYCVHKAKKIRQFGIWGSHNVAFDSLTDSKEAQEGVITDENILRRYKSSAMKRDFNGRSSVMNPVLPKHITNKEYVDKQTATCLKKLYDERHLYFSSGKTKLAGVKNGDIICGYLYVNSLSVVYPFTLYIETGSVNRTAIMKFDNLKLELAYEEDAFYLYLYIDEVLSSSNYDRVVFKTFNTI